MIQKLRNRLLTITMLLLSIVLIITFSILIISSANRMKTESFQSLQESYLRVDTADKGLPDFEDTANTLLPTSKKEKPFDGYESFSTFFVTLDEENVIRSIDDFSRSLDEATFTEAVEEALAQGETEGVINSLNLRFKVFVQTDSVTIIGFIDRSYERSFISQQIINYCFIGLGSLVAFFLVSLLLSKIAIRPVEKAWQKQQQFVADASHELKTPITVMLANTSILLSGSVKEEQQQKKWISYIELEAKRMKKLVEDMLFLARVDSEENNNIHAKMSLSNAVSESVLPFEAVFFESGKELEADIEDDVFIKGESGQVKQLVGILLDNANKYANDNSKISIKLFKDNGKAVLEVNNIGEVIDSKDIPIIFDRFIRADKARTRDKNSYGLGLAIAKEIVTAHKGKICVQSTKEKGTTFTVTLPAV